jgi:hypothetical protein
MIKNERRVESKRKGRCKKEGGIKIRQQDEMKQTVGKRQMEVNKKQHLLS